MSHSLEAQQAALLHALHLSTPEFIAHCTDSVRAASPISFKNQAATLRGLRAYRANAQTVCVTALQAAYPSLAQLLGDENFAHLAHRLWQALPPLRGDLAQWGGDLPTFMAEFAPLQELLSEHPYLPDVARVEWALHCASTASDAAFDAPSFQLLSESDPGRLRLRLAPGCSLHHSAFPVVAVVQLHDARAADWHSQARQAVMNQQAQIALVWRQGLRPMLISVDLASAAFIQTCLQGESLSLALDAALEQDARFDFSAWLAQQVHAGVLLGVT